MTREQWLIVLAAAGMTLVGLMMWGIVFAFFTLLAELVRTVLARLRLWPVGFEYYVAMPGTLLIMVVSIFLLYWAFGSWRPVGSPYWISLAAAMPLTWLVLAILDLRQRVDDASVQRSTWKGAVGALISGTFIVAMYYMPNWNQAVASVPTTVWHFIYKG